LAAFSTYSFKAQSQDPQPKESFIMTLTKETITKSIADRLDFSKAAAFRAAEATFEIIKQTLEGGEDVLISRFGKFCVRSKDQRRGRNPTTGEPLMLDGRRVVVFKCSSVLKGKLNGGRYRI
jgi:integration host factor subunit alpha